MPAPGCISTRECWSHTGSSEPSEDFAANFTVQPSGNPQEISPQSHMCGTPKYMKMLFCFHCEPDSSAIFSQNGFVRAEGPAVNSPAREGGEPETL